MWLVATTGGVLSALTVLLVLQQKEKIASRSIVKILVSEEAKSKQSLTNNQYRHSIYCKKSKKISLLKSHNMRTIYCMSMNSKERRNIYIYYLSVLSPFPSCLRFATLLLLIPPRRRDSKEPIILSLDQSIVHLASDCTFARNSDHRVLF